MATKRPRPSTRSSNPKTTKGGQATGGAEPRKARAHRDDTPEARAQRERLPKTHPSNARSRPAARKDK